LFFLSAPDQPMGANAWRAWIGEMVRPEVRGRFIARRSRILLLAGATLAFAGGALVDRFQNGSLGFAKVENLPKLMALLFLLATVAGVVGLFILRRQPEDPKAPESESAAELLALPMRDSNFRRLLLFNVWWMLAIGVGAPFWQPYMITGFGMSLVSIQIYGTISTVSALLTVGLWGRFVDHFGNRLAMALAILAGGINPLAWLIASPETLWIIYLEAASAGAMWAGAGLVGMNFVLAIAPPERKQIYAGVQGAASGLAMMATMILSGAILPEAMNIAGLHLDSEQVLFGLTGILRWSALIPLVFIAEPVVPSTSESLYQIRQFAKVRVAMMAERIFRQK
nr:MFS transporter [bacterium]